MRPRVLLVNISCFCGILLGVDACSPRAPTHSNQVRSTACSPVVVARLGDESWNMREAPTYLREVVPAALATSFGVLRYADTLDLDCDGTADFIMQAVTSDSAAKLVDVIYVSTATGLREVLRTPSAVDGREALAIAADLSGSGKRDVVLLGGDEGGYVPRVFRWTDEHLQEVIVSRQYILRFEADWSKDCQRKANPGMAGEREVTLMRETISPTSVSGHGAECALPVDTLVVRGDSLVPK